MFRKSIAAGGILGLGVVLGWLFQARMDGNFAFGFPQQRGGVTTTLAPVVPAPAGEMVVGLPPQLQLPEGFIPSTNDEAVHVAVYETVNRGVVNISTRAVRPEAFLMVAEIEGNGSGSIIDQQGHVLTNYHVIEGARDINVTLFNGESYAGELVGQDPDNDIAVLKISAPPEVLFPIAWGDSSNLRVGQHIIAIGNPFGLERTMSTGIISSLNRQITSKTRRQIRSIIQIDAALNQGNSGGPLLNARGELIGMNTAIATRSGDNAGIGFAIPVNTMSRVVPQLIATGRVARPTIGILQVFETEKGLLIVNMTPGGPAEQAGLQGSRVDRRRIRRGFGVFEQETVDHSQADLIVAIDGQKVERADDLLSVIETKKAGEQVMLTVLRGGRSIQLPVTLGSGE
ncbi:MAG: trypsin-like peptidase domain-containing protein [Pirellula sp.]|nr:trypsin-like peptidase domain-containing protein [Pirellula sp.]